MHSQPPENLRTVEAFAHHLFLLYVDELSRRTGAAPQHRSANEGSDLALPEHKCEDICHPIVYNLVSAYLNPGMLQRESLTTSETL